MKKTNQLGWFLCLTLFTLLVTSCRTSPHYWDLSMNTRYEVLQFPSLTTPKAYREIIWPKDQRVTVFVYNGYEYIEGQPYVIESDPTMRYLGLEQDKACSLRTDYSLPTLLPDGRLGLRKKCVTGTRNPLLIGSVKSYLVAYDWKTGKLEQIVQASLPDSERSGCFSWNPEMTLAVQGTYDGLSGGLYWLTPNGHEPLNLVLHDGPRSWDLGKSYVAIGNDINEGIATCASWSPDGEHIAFFATLKAMGLEGFARGNQPHNLYSYSVNTGKAESLLDGIYSPYNVQWSPNNKLIAFLGRVANNSREDLDLWVFDPPKNQLYLVDTGFFGHFIWSPNSDKIAIIWCPDLLCGDSRKTEIRNYTINLP